MTSTKSPHTAAANRVVHLEDSRMARRERGELATEGIAALTLLDAVRTSYTLHQIDAFVVLNAIAGIALATIVLLGVIKLKRHRDASSSGVNIVGVFGGVATIVEGLHKLHTAQFTFGHKHFALGMLTIVAGIMTTAIALMMERLEHRRALTITNDGIRMRLNNIRRFDVPWTNMTELWIGDKKAELRCANGRARVVPLARLVNRDEIRDALVQAAHAHEIKITIDATS